MPRLLAFGAVDGSLWAAALDGPAPALVIGSGEAGTGLAGTFDWSGDTLSGDGVALALTARPAVDGDGPGVTGSATPGQSLVHVSGTVTVGGSERSVECPGVVVESESDGSGVLRLVGAWFGEAEALALLAGRPSADAPPDADRLAASLFEPSGWIAVGEPRLSTTYDADGLPTRVTLELWVGEGEEEFPRRAAGEVSGPPAAVSAGPGGASLQVSPLRCHSRGEDGAGVYALVTR